MKGRSAEAVVRASLSYTLHRIETYADVVCPDGAGLVKPYLDVCTDITTDERVVCQTCGRS